MTKTRSRIPRSAEFTAVHNEPKQQPESDELHAAPKIAAAAATPNTAPIRIDGLRVETSDRDASYTEEGVPELMSFTKAVFRLFGTGFTEKTVVTITEVKNQYGGPCILPAAGQFRAIAGTVDRNTMLVEILMPKSDTYFYFCTKMAEEEGASLVSLSSARLTSGMLYFNNNRFKDQSRIEHFSRGIRIFDTTYSFDFSFDLYDSNKQSQYTNMKIK